MSAQVCPICGATPDTCLHWTMCPKRGALVCLMHCIKCRHLEPDNWHCQYYNDLRAALAAHEENGGT
ncbi:hypothetical protein [Allofournierella sp.]|uniref:hypothetical protein n=1 Tax=Allofournierella sp. TaxID=1940256 RepID=UPI003AF152AC